MFTVIIAEKEYIDKIKEYNLFLDPFLKSGSIQYCLWDTTKDRFAEMLPSIADQVGRRKEWRAIIICKEDGIDKQNPFDFVSQKPDKFSGDIYSDAYKTYLDKEHQKKLEAYEEAAKNPLTRLVTFFCNAPIVTKEADSMMTDGDSDYQRYIECSRRKRELREMILSNELVEIAQPTEIICIAKRTYTSSEDEFETVWSTHTEAEYSRFYDRNMYFDKMRYLVFDILPKVQRDYEFDYIRFLYATILLASNDIPNGCLAPERVYCLECKNDDHSLCVLLKSYEASLNCTKENLLQLIRDIREKSATELSDDEAYRIIHTRVEQTVALDDSVDAEDLYADSGQIGLANSEEKNEAVLWEGEYNRSRKNLSKILKQSRKALRRAATTVQAQQDKSVENVFHLNEFQLEDIRDYVDAQELKLFKMDMADLYDEEALFHQLEQSDAQIKEKIETRMFGKTTIALIAIACGVYLLGFFTVFMNNSERDFSNFGTTLLLLSILLFAFVLTAVVTLFFMRRELVSKFREFNTKIHNVNVKLHDSLGQYTKYLTHICNVRRGYTVLNMIEKNVNPESLKEVLYRKHITDIELIKERTQSVFGQFMIEGEDTVIKNASPYDFDFDQPIDYTYPLPYTEGITHKITFIQPGVTAQVPVEFVKEIIVRREELYE